MGLEVFIVTALLIFVLKYRQFNKIYSLYAISLLLGFVFFSLATDTLNTPISTMFLIVLICYPLFGQLELKYSLCYVEAQSL